MKQGIWFSTTGSLLLSLLLFSCGPKSKMPEATLKDEDLAGKVAAVYTGEVPCADCEGIAYRLNIQPDFTYEAQMIYKGKSEEPFEFSGGYAFTEDSILVLEKEEPGMNYFRIVPAGLLMLDMEGKEVTGALADKYLLTQSISEERGMEQQVSREGQINSEMIRKLHQDGIDFYAMGNEPFWSLNMDFDKMFRFTTMNGEALNTPPTEGVMAQDAPVTRYAAETEAGSMIITIMAGACADNMSGEPFTHKVRVEFKQGVDAEYKTFEGCGRYVTDLRLEGVWTLVSMDGQPVEAANLPKGPPQLSFDADALRIGGHSSCNNLMGSFQMEKNAIAFGQMASTMMACPDMKLESEFNKLISGRHLKYEIAGDQLTLTHPGGQNLVFKKE